MRMARKAIIWIFLNKRAHLYLISDIGGVLVVDSKKKSKNRTKAWGPNMPEFGKSLFKPYRMLFETPI